MTEPCLKSISPDSLTGMIFALEGLRNTVVLLNGPMGCRFYHSTTSQFLAVRPILYLPVEEGGERVPVDYNYLNDWFFRQERVPCTYLDGEDFVYGSGDKVQAALRFIRENIDFDLLAVVNSPGASLIGDNMLELARRELGDTRAVMLESPGLSTSFEEGYAEALRALLTQVGRGLWQTPPTKKRGVNLLGLSIWHRYCEGDIRELKRLLGLCGIEVNSVLCAGSSLDELRRLPEAELNVVLYPELGLDAARLLEEDCGTPWYLCPTAPVGFEATERFIRDVCRLLGRSPAPVLAESERARGLAWYKIDQIYQSSGRPRGSRFFVKTFPAMEKAYRAFLTDYLGMAASPPEEAELVFSDANVIAELKLKNRVFCGIEVSLPGMGYTDLIPKTHLGLEGALFLIEQVLNGLMTRLSD